MTEQTTEVSIPRWALVVVLLLASGLSFFSAHLYNPGEYRDDVAYIAAARGAAQGFGFSRIHLVEPVPETLYPVGYPLLLTPAQYAAPDAYWLLQFLTGLTGLAALVLLWKLDPETGPIATILLALNSFWLHSATSIMSDVPFTLVFLGWLLLLRHCADSPELGKKERIGLAVSVAALVYLRSIGLVLMPITALALIHRKRDWNWLLVSSYTVGLVSLGIVFSRIGGYRGAINDSPALLSVFTDNLPYYAKMVPPILVGKPFHFLYGNGYLPFWVAFLPFFCLVLLGAHYQAKQRQHLIWFNTLTFSAIYLIWPYQAPRFWVPLLPLFYLLILDGARYCGKSVKRPKLWLGLAAAVLLIELAVLAPSLKAPGLQLPESYQWLLSNSEESDHVTTQESSIWLLTGRKQVPLSPVQATSQPERWVEYLYYEDVRWVVFWDSSQTQLLNLICSTLPQHFRLRYEDPKEGVKIYEVIGDSKACRVAGAWVNSASDSFTKGDYGKASSSLVKALRLQPWFVYPRVLLAECHLASGDPELARRILQDVLRVSPQYGPAKQALKRIP